MFRPSKSEWESENFLWSLPFILWSFSLVLWSFFTFAFAFARCEQVLKRKRIFKRYCNKILIVRCVADICTNRTWRSQIHRNLQFIGGSMGGAVDSPPPSLGPVSLFSWNFQQKSCRIWGFCPSGFSTPSLSGNPGSSTAIIHHIPS